MSPAKNGELVIVVYFTHLRCTYSPCLSTWLHLRCSYRMKILPVVVSMYSRCIRNINLQCWSQLFAIKWNGSFLNLYLRLTWIRQPSSFSVFRFPFSVFRFPFSVFRLTGSTTTASPSLFNLWGKVQLAASPEIKDISSPLTIISGISYYTPEQ